MKNKKYHTVGTVSKCTTASSVMNSDISELNTSGDSNWTTTYSTVSSTGTGEYRFT
jgi:hypothetical protein